MMDLCRKLEQKEVDFMKAFNLVPKDKRGCPWPKGADGAFANVPPAVAIAMSNGALNEESVKSITGEDGTVSMAQFNTKVIPGWSLLAAVSAPPAAAEAK